MSRLSVHLLGRFSVRRDDEEVGSLQGAKAQELLAYLLLNRGRSCRREALAEILWTDNTATQARKYFRQTLWQLQAALGNASRQRAEQPHTLLIEADWVRINPNARVWLDVEVLENAAEQCQGIAGKDIGPSAASVLREAVRVYRGDLLESWPYEWCLYERERLLVANLRLLEKLMAFCEAQHAYDEAIEYGAQILRFDRAQERTHRRLMRLHYLAGDRSEALRQYARCTQALRVELDVHPSARTTTLYHQILADRLDAVTTEAPAERVLNAASPSGGEVDASVHALRALLVGFETHVTAAIDRLERLSTSRI